MKKLVLGLCLVFGANVLNAEEYSCTYNFKKFGETSTKAQKAYDLGLEKESSRYVSEAEYYAKQVMIECDSNSEKFKLAKTLVDNFADIDEGK